MRLATTTPSSEKGALPRNIQPESWWWTVPSRRCRIAPTVLKMAPWRMSVPTASVGWKPKTMTRIGVIREPPPIPVIPTSTPISRPVRTNCQVMPLLPVRLDQHLGDLGPRELDRRNIAVSEHLAHLRSRQGDAVLVPVRTALRAGHRTADSAPESVLEEHRLDVELVRLEL